MNTKHLNDFEIQKFTFDQSECEPEIIDHIQVCLACKKRVEAYFSLSSAIKNQPEPILEYNLSDLVLDQIPSTSKPEKSYNYIIYSLLTASIGLIISTLFLFSETLFDLFNNALNIQYSFIISITLFISFLLGFDLFRSFNKKINKLSS